MAFKELIQDPKITASVAGSTTLTAWIPDDIGKIAALVGIVLSLILIYVNILSARKTHLEWRILQRREEERQERAQRHQSTGQPLRREDDHPL